LPFLEIGFVFSNHSVYQITGLSGSDYQGIGLSGLFFLIPWSPDSHILISWSADLLSSLFIPPKADLQ
jgi:hypothetical protein